MCGVVVMIASCVSSECCSAGMLNWMKAKANGVVSAITSAVLFPFAVYNDLKFMRNYSNPDRKKCNQYYWQFVHQLSEFNPEFPDTLNPLVEYRNLYSNLIEKLFGANNVHCTKIDWMDQTLRTAQQLIDLRHGNLDPARLEELRENIALTGWQFKLPALAN